jgi:hypothetical protein
MNLRWVAQQLGIGSWKHDSPAAFVRCSLVQKKDAELGVLDRYAHYQNWCRLNHVRPFASKAFSQVAKDEMEISFGLKVRHDLPGENQRARRGWKNVALVETADEGNTKKASSGSVG